MSFGLTVDGLVIKRLADIKAETEATLRAKLGNAINLLSQETLGQIVGITSEREALIWELLLAVYNSQYPPTAGGVSLDLNIALTGQVRLDATKSLVDVYCTGVQSTLIPQGSIVSVENNPTAKFESTVQAEIGAGVNEVQTITFSNVPTGGIFTLVFQGETTADMDQTTDAADVQAALNALVALSGVTVAGSFAAGFVVTFAGADGEKPQPLLAYGTNTLNMGGVNTIITIVETTPGELPHISILFQATVKGEIDAKAGTLTVIETPVAGWDAAINLTDADVGRHVELDSELRIRREQTLANPGSSTVDAIYSKLKAIDEVDAVKVYTNRENVPDIAGRPPHCFECVVKEGNDNEIAMTIWKNCPSGIEIYGSVHIVVVDSQGFSQDVYFSRPDDVLIYLEVDLETNSLFPAGGATTIENSILDYAKSTFSIGDDVITDWLYCPINVVPGIVNITIRIGIAPNPITDANIPIADVELALFDSSRIDITIL